MSDEEDEAHVVQDQEYDESMDVPDGEDVTTMYTPVPTNRKNPGAPNSHLNPVAGKFSREQPIARNPQNHTPDTSPRPHNDDTQDETDSDPASSQESNGGSGQKEYKSSDVNAYDPKMYHDLPVSEEVKDIFKLIEKYQPQDIPLETKLKPFIPDYVPSIGDIDAFLKVERPDGKEDSLGLLVVDEPSAKQSDPHVLSLQMRYTSKQPIASNLLTNIRNVPNADKHPKAIEEWIGNISKLQKTKTTDTVQYRKPMPNVDNLMQEWPTQFEELLKETSVPSADIDADLSTYTDIACSLLDIPVYESRIQSLHTLFTLYLGFKNSEHFKAMIDATEPPFRRGANNAGADQMIID